MKLYPQHWLRPDRILLDDNHDNNQQQLIATTTTTSKPAALKSRPRDLCARQGPPPTSTHMAGKKGKHPKVSKWRTNSGGLIWSIEVGMMWIVLDWYKTYSVWFIRFGRRYRITDISLPRLGEIYTNRERMYNVPVLIDSTKVTRWPWVLSPHGHWIAEMIPSSRTHPWKTAS